MNLLTTFHFALSKTTFDELKGITQSPLATIHHLHDQDDIVLGCMDISVGLDAAIVDIISSLYRTQTTYHLKYNSLNFNITELPFQTYISFLTKADVEYAIPSFPKEVMGYNGFTEFLNNLLNHIPMEKVTTCLEHTLLEIVAEQFDPELFFKELGSFNLSPEDSSRLWNHMLIISVLVKDDKVKSILAINLEEISLNKRIKTLE